LMEKKKKKHNFPRTEKRIVKQAGGKVLRASGGKKSREKEGETTVMGGTMDKIGGNPTPKRGNREILVKKRGWNFFRRGLKTIRSPLGKREDGGKKERFEVVETFRVKKKKKVKSKEVSKLQWRGVVVLTPAGKKRIVRRKRERKPGEGLL